jgi:anti-sigma regulatory factor (Ser/Thr protein kinase)
MVAGGTVSDEEDSARIELPTDDSAPALARSHVRRTLRRWALPGVVESLTLVVSELVSNAVRHGRPPVELLLRRVGHGVRVDVHDEGSVFGPVKTTSDSDSEDPDAEGGRGLPLIDAVSVDHGVDHIPNDGKRVWAVVEPEAGTPAG